MNLLLDTHIALWAVTDDDRLSEEARGLIADLSNQVSVSVVSLWEIAIKHALDRDGHGRMPLSAAEALSHFEAAGYGMIEVKPQHAVGVEQLPSLHADPFDRMLIAQAREIPLRLITHDRIVASYGETQILV